jgi:hypothetical protein
MSSPETRDLTFAIDVPYYGRITPDLDDTLYRYRQPQFDHIRYHTCVELQTEQGAVLLQKIRALFVGATVLDLLAKHGVPEAYVDTPTKAVADAYQADQIDRFELEVGDIEVSDNEPE